MFAVPSFFLKKKKENEATVLFSKTKMTLERFHGPALQKETTPVQTKRDMERRKMFQQKASTRRTVRGSTDSDWCCTVRFVVILIYLLLVLLPKRNENYLCKQKRERKEKVPVPPAQTFSRSKNISFLPGWHEFSPPGSSALVLLAPAPWRHWLYSVSTSSTR
jgi:hypothetical protein